MTDRTEQETNRDNYDIRESHRTGIFVDDTGQPQGHIRLGAWSGGTTSDEYEKKRKADAKWCEAQHCKRMLLLYGPSK
ncbi:hypothetical protein LCGC14_2422570 [marine sediment metagenome]|uniref:Uncharacterized protein n=1 Tax=marine sediment metagenome TaxID=412755 RepID=A0A0F9BPE6_9ZZZZ